MPTNLSEADTKTWIFEIDGFHLDAFQQAKSKVAKENENVRYRDLKARVINQNALSNKYVSVVKIY